MLINPRLRAGYNANRIRSVMRIGKGLFLLVVVAVAFRALFPLFGDYSPYHPDSRCYLTMASAIADGRPLRGFPNGYPLILSTLELLTGGDYPPASIAIFLNCVMSLALALFAYKLVGFLTGNENIRLVVAFLLAVSPLQLHYAHKILTEVPTAFLMAAGSILLLKRRHFSAGLLTTLGIWLRPSLLLLPLGYLLWIASAHKKCAPAMQFVAGVIIVNIVATVLTAAGITAPSKTTAANILYSIAGKSSTLRVGLLCDTYRIELLLDDFSEEAQKHPIRTYCSFVVNNPLQYASQRLDAFFELWSPWVSSRDDLYPHHPLAQCFRLINSLFFCCSLALGVYVTP